MVVLRSTGLHVHVNSLTLRRWPFVSIGDLVSFQLSMVQKNRARTPRALEVTADKHRTESHSCSGPTAFAFQSSPGSKFYSTRSYKEWLESSRKCQPRKGDGSGDGEELGGAEEGEAIITIYYVRKTSIFDKGEQN